MIEKMISRANPEVYKLYKTLIEYFDKEVKDIPGIEAIKVSETIYKAMSDRIPIDKYLIGPGANKMNILRKFPAKIRDKMLSKAIYK